MRARARAGESISTIIVSINFELKNNTIFQSSILGGLRGAVYHGLLCVGVWVWSVRYMAFWRHATDLGIETSKTLARWATVSRAAIVEGNLSAIG